MGSRKPDEPEEGSSEVLVLGGIDSRSTSQSVYPDLALDHVTVRGRLV